MRRSLSLAALLLLFASAVRAAPPATLPVIALDTQSRKPVPGVTIHWNLGRGEGGKGSAQTDATGTAAIPADPAALKSIALKASAEGCVPEAIYWNRSTTQPATVAGPFIFLIEKGTQISGRAVDENDRPIAGAHVFIRVVKKYAGSPQNVDLSWHSTRSDAQGRWSLDGVPADPDRLEVGGYDLMHLDNESFQLAAVAPAVARAGNAVVRLPTGTPMEVHVMKPDGTPAAGTGLFLGRASQVVNSVGTATADEHGVIRLGVKPGLGLLLTASLDGFGPAQANVTATSEPQQVSIRLTERHARTLQLVDSAGQPVRGVRVYTVQWHGQAVFPDELTSDDTGRIEWDRGPADPVTVSLFADGFTSRELPWEADRTTRVVMLRPTIVTGRVVDADTGRPIDAFTLRAGASWHEGDSVIWQRNDFGSNRRVIEPGQFRLTLDDPAYRYVLRVTAEGHLPEETPAFEPDGTPRRFNFKLKSAPPTSGRVLTPDGKPVAGACVMPLSAGSSLMLRDSAVPSPSDRTFDDATSDADGRFSLRPEREDFVIVALADAGTATLTRSQLTAANGEAVLHLAAWSTVRGTLRVHGKPAGGADLFADAEPTLLGDGTPLVTRRFTIDTDAEGRFTLWRVPPGRLTIRRVVSNHAPGRSWLISVASIDVKPGSTTTLDLGGDAVVTGRLAIPRGKPWMVRQARLEPANKPHQQGWENVEVFADGRFRADGLVPGEYRLRVALHEFPPDNECGWGRVVGEYDRDVTISRGTPGLDVGEVGPRAAAPSDLQPGDAPPDFTVTTLDGQRLRLSELRGKVVLLDFWATWCAPCVAAVPDLKAIQAAHAHGPFTVVSLSLDEDDATVRRFVQQSQMTWPQARVGVDSPTVAAYGATAVPATLLIDRHGRLIARDLHGEELSKAVRDALAK